MAPWGVCISGLGRARSKAPLALAQSPPPPPSSLYGHQPWQSGPELLGKAPHSEAFSGPGKSILGAQTLPLLAPAQPAQT